MFSEAQDADVYIADLTGANPNVYLELGVRWALRDKVTILICQSVKDLKFNVSPSRALPYHPDIIIKAIDDVVNTIINGLNSSEPDSLVRLNSDYVTISRTRIDELETEIERLKKDRGEDLLLAANATEELSSRIVLLKQAVQANPASTRAFLELGKAQRGLRQYNEAVGSFQTALRLSPNNSKLHRELGVTFSKQENSGLAVSSLREAVRLSPDDSEAWSNLGGALRRVGTSNAPESYNKDALLESRECYSKANELKPFDLYSGLNVSRVDLMLSRWEANRADQAKQGFSSQVHLCRHMVQQNPKDYWNKFNLADALLFSGNYAEANLLYDDAISAVPISEREDALRNTVLGPLKGYIAASVLDGELLIEVKKVIMKLETAISAGDSQQKHE